jgi:hypothetical protein
MSLDTITDRKLVLGDGCVVLAAEADLAEVFPVSS